jgi:hypothetical protein
MIDEQAGRGGYIRFLRALAGCEVQAGDPVWARPCHTESKTRARSREGVVSSTSSNL